MDIMDNENDDLTMEDVDETSGTGEAAPTDPRDDDRGHVDNGERSVDDDKPDLNDDDETDEGAIYDSDREIAAKVMDHVIDIRVDGLYGDDGQTRGRLRLRRHPPTMVFSKHRSGDESDRDAEVRVMMNQALAHRLSIIFHDMDMAFDGIRKTEKRRFTWESFRKSVRDYWTYQPLKFVGGVLLAVVVAALVIFGFIVS
jgi:hypothetical protein